MGILFKSFLNFFFLRKLFYSNGKFKISYLKIYKWYTLMIKVVLNSLRNGLSYCMLKFFDTCSLTSAKIQPWLRHTYPAQGCWIYLDSKNMQIWDVHLEIKCLYKSTFNVFKNVSIYKTNTPLCTLYCIKLDKIPEKIFLKMQHFSYAYFVFSFTRTYNINNE